MTLVLATLTFLTVLWAIVVVGSMVLDQSGAKILAALLGERQVRTVHSIAVRARHAPRHMRSVRASARLRAAA